MTLGAKGHWVKVCAWVVVLLVLGVQMAWEGGKLARGGRGGARPRWEHF